MEVFYALAVILLTAFMFAPLGLGGGILFVPTLHYILGWDLHLSIVGSLILIWFVSIGSRRAHDEGGYTVAEIGRRGRLFAIGGAILGALAADILITEGGDNTIKLLATILLSWVLYRSISKLREEKKTNVADEDIEPQMEDKELIRYKLGCLGGGAASGLIGVGGGVIFTMMNRTILGLKPHRAAGTSYLIVMRVVPVAIISHLLIEPELWSDLMALDPLALAIPIVVLLTSWGGAKTAIKMLPQRVLTYPYLVAVFVSLIRYLIDVKEIIGT